MIWKSNHLSENPVSPGIASLHADADHQHASPLSGLEAVIAMTSQHLQCAHPSGSSQPAGVKQGHHTRRKKKKKKADHKKLGKTICWVSPSWTYWYNERWCGLSVDCRNAWGARRVWPTTLFPVSVICFIILEIRYVHEVGWKWSIVKNAKSFIKSWVSCQIRHIIYAVGVDDCMCGCEDEVLVTGKLCTAVKVMTRHGHSVCEL